MSGIKRYDVYFGWSGDLEVVHEELGDFVFYNDHISEVKALQEEIALLKSKLNFDWDSVK